MSSVGLDQKVQDAKVEGWEIKEQTGDRAVMIRRKKGTLGSHLVIFLLLGWWNLGLGNVVYLAYKYFLDVDKKVLRAED